MGDSEKKYKVVVTSEVEYMLFHGNGEVSARRGCHAYNNHHHYSNDKCRVRTDEEAVLLHTFQERAETSCAALGVGSELCLAYRKQATDAWETKGCRRSRWQNYKGDNKVYCLLGNHRTTPDRHHYNHQPHRRIMTSLHGTPSIKNYRHLYEGSTPRPNRGCGQTSSGSVVQDVVVKHEREEQKVAHRDDQSVMAMLEQSPQFTMFVRWIKDSGLEDLYRDPDSHLTVFAVPDSKLERMPEHLWLDIDGVGARGMIQFSTLPYEMMFREMRYRRQGLTSLYKSERLMADGNGINSVRIGRRATSSSVSPTTNYSSEIIHADALASNGVIHVVNLPVLPCTGPTATSSCC